MKIAIMQPYLFPYIGYFQLINAVDQFVIFDDVNYIVKGWVNRNRILVDGKAHMFTIPLKEASKNRLINDIEISDNSNWRTKLMKTLEMSYRKAPYYDDVIQTITRIIMSETRLISKLIKQSLDEVNSYLDIDTVIKDTSEIYDNRHLRGEDRIIDICRKERADHYINLAGGMELYSKERFKNIGIELFFIKSKPINYRQFNNEFVPWLSIIDIMMFNSKDDIRQFLMGYELI